MIDLGGPVEERVYLVESTLTTSYFLPPGEIPPPPIVAPTWHGAGSFPTGGRDFEATSVGTLQPPFYFAFANVDFTTKANDPDKPSQWWDGRVKNPGNLTRAISLTSVGDGAVEASDGSIVIDNTDRTFDTILDDFYAVSQEVAIRLADPEKDWADFETLWLLRITGIGLSETELTLEGSGPLVYSQNYFPISFYSGAGSVTAPTGDEGLTNVQKPVVLGRVWNWKPVLIDAIRLIFQLHDGPISAVTSVFDGGVPLLFHASYATYAQLAAATIPSGRYGQCTSQGCIRLGGSPVNDVTVHMDGALGAGNTVRSIATWLATALEPQIWVDFNLATFALLPAFNAGWVWTEPFTYQEALSRFIGDAGWVWGSLQVGPITVGQLLPPDMTGVEREFDEFDIVRLERMPLPSGYESTHLRRIVHYHRNWTVQGQSGLAFTAVDSIYRTQEWRSVVASSPTDARNALDAPVLDTCLHDAAAAQALADQLIDLHGVRRKLYNLETKIYGTMPALGSNILLTYPRFGLDGGIPFRLISLRHDFEQGLASLMVWG